MIATPRTAAAVALFAAVILCLFAGTGCATNKSKAAKASAGADGVPISPAVTNINPAPAARPVVPTAPNDSTYAPPLTGGYGAAPSAAAPGAYASMPAYSQTPTAPAAMPAAMPAASGATASGAYTVKKGDTLFRIAHDRYGDGKQWNRIVAANPGLSPGSLKVGQRIVIP